MPGLIKRIAEFIVFRNVFIAIAASCLVAESRFLSGQRWFVIDALVLFTFFSTFLIYNFHSFSNDSESEFSLPQIFKDFINPAISLEQRICVGIGIVGTFVTFLFLEKTLMLFLIPIGIVTLSYSLPVFKSNDRLRSLRDIPYVKIFTVAIVWAIATTLPPYLSNVSGNSLPHFFLLLAERFLFIYAITLPFEIRDRHHEKEIGNRTIPIIYGVEKSKLIGYVILLCYCFTVFIREHYFGQSRCLRMEHLIALFLSAISAAILIFMTNDTRSRWFYKFLIDGTIIEQFFLLILVQKLC